MAQVKLPQEKVKVLESQQPVRCQAQIVSGNIAGKRLDVFS